MHDRVAKEVDDIADKTRVVPITMIVAVVLALALFSALVFGIYQDDSEGSLRDAEGVVNETTVELMQDTIHSE